MNNCADTKSDFEEVPKSSNSQKNGDASDVVEDDKNQLRARWLVL